MTTVDKATARPPEDAQPLVSCIVPIWNGSTYLAEALDSILAQTYKPIELLVVDDGSTDGSDRIAAAYGGRLRLIYQEHAGPPAARNTGLAAARGSFIAILDSDDRWHPEKLARQMARFDARPELDLCNCWVQNFWEPELAAEAERYRGHRRAQPVPGYVAATLLARRSAFDAVGSFDERLVFGDAPEWFVRARRRGLLLETIPEVLLYRRLHSRNHTRVAENAAREQYLELLREHLDRQRADRT
jgi:glycosyltransferase involved in cell wall biosynthesis